MSAEILKKGRATRQFRDGVDGLEGRVAIQVGVLPSTKKKRNKNKKSSVKKKTNLRIFFKALASSIC
jgi:hypothetical protein